jgi:hypothetical protein
VGGVSAAAAASGYATVSDDASAGAAGVLDSAVRRVRGLVDVFVLPSGGASGGGGGGGGAGARLAGSCCLRASKSGPLKECAVLITLQSER